MSLILDHIPITNRNSNISFRRKILSSKNRISSLDFNFISFSSQDPSHPIKSIFTPQNTPSNEGWLSNRYCAYPQEIMIKFQTEVNIRQLNILSAVTNMSHTCLKGVTCRWISCYKAFQHFFESHQKSVGRLRKKRG